MSTVAIRTATSSDRGPVTAALTLAFSGDPAARWAWPDPQQYLACFPEFVAALGGQAFEGQTAYCVDGFAGAALWLRPGVAPDEDALIALFQRSVPEPDQADVFAVLKQMGSYHPSEPHWYLPLIGVDPAHQRQGLGSALMEHALRECDRDHLPAYLESSNPANISLYQRHGFELLGTIRAGASPPISPMLRQPR